jgi:hypothetical protein
VFDKSEDENGISLIDNNVFHLCLTKVKKSCCLCGMSQDENCVGAKVLEECIETEGRDPLTSISGRD